LAFRELRWTCLRYRSASIHGSGFGPELWRRVIRTARQIVELPAGDKEAQ
jgi:hypothetical protein